MEKANAKYRVFKKEGDSITDILSAVSKIFERPTEISELSFQYSYPGFTSDYRVIFRVI